MWKIIECNPCEGSGYKNSDLKSFDNGILCPVCSGYGCAPAKTDFNDNLMMLVSPELKETWYYKTKKQSNRAIEYGNEFIMKS